MFLICISEVLDVIEHFLCIIQNNSVFIGIITSIIVGARWFRKYIEQKRAEAFFGFYAKLYLRLRTLRTRLEENDQLNITNSGNGNIYSLVYTEDVMVDVCPGYKELEKKSLKSCKDAAKELKKLLVNTDNNVYPQGSKREEWYKSQHIIFMFCEFLENDAYKHITNEEYDKDDQEFKHIVKCRMLIEAMTYIQDSINNAQY